MFTTDLCLGKAVNHPDWTLHDRFYLEAATPFFLVGFQSLDGEIRTIEYVIVSSTALLAGLLTRQNSSSGVVELQVCSPPRVNESQYWQLEPLVALSVSIGTESGTQYFWYKTVSGRIFADEPREQCTEPYIMFTTEALVPPA